MFQNKMFTHKSHENEVIWTTEKLNLMKGKKGFRMNSGGMQFGKGENFEYILQKNSAITENWTRIAVMVVMLQSTELSSQLRS